MEEDGFLIIRGGRKWASSFNELYSYIIAIPPRTTHANQNLQKSFNLNIEIEI